MCKTLLMQAHHVEIHMIPLYVFIHENVRDEGAQTTIMSRIQPSFHMIYWPKCFRCLSDTQSLTPTRKALHPYPGVARNDDPHRWPAVSGARGQIVCSLHTRVSSVGVYVTIVSCRHPPADKTRAYDLTCRRPLSAAPGLAA